MKRNNRPLLPLLLLILSLSFACSKKEVKEDFLIINQNNKSTNVVLDIGSNTSKNNSNNTANSTDFNSLINANNSCNKHTIKPNNKNSNHYDLALFGFTIPSTIVVGQTVAISGYITNNAQNAYVGDALNMSFGLANEVPDNFDDIVKTDITHNIIPPVTVIPPNQTIYYEQDIVVTEVMIGNLVGNKKASGSDKNVIIIWPTLVMDTNMENNFVTEEITISY